MYIRDRWCSVYNELQHYDSGYHSKESIITKSGYVYDLVVDDEGNMYCSYTTKDAENKVQGAVTKLRIDGTKSHYTIDNKGMIRTGGKLIRNDKGTWYFIAQWNPSFYDNYLVVAEMDSAFNILWTWRSPWADRIYGVRDVLAINNDQVLILAGGVTYDSIYKEEAFVHWVYRYDLKERKVLWRRNYGHPPSSDITPGCRVVASQRDEDTWLMCTTVVLAGSTREHYVIAGRVAKFTVDGDTLWAKDYVLYKDAHFDRNYFVTMIPTMEGNYLLGGFYLGDGCRSWLVKIDEDGNIVSRDTTSSLADFAPEDSDQSLRVYPNPASDKIEVHYTSDSGDEVGGYTLSVKNVSGREVYNIYTRSATNQIPVSDLAAGVYYVSVVIAGQVRKTVRFIKVQ
ncbi:MAG: T9SS type A sorting domain-containing protein [Saprospiraceae bacterium]|nr:T9SS type A sorting domain-containing protein [Saprospiraceae bacterium]